MRVGIPSPFRGREDVNLYTLYYGTCYEIVTAVTDNYSASAFSPFQQDEIVSKTLQMPIGLSRNLKIVL